MEPKIKKSVIIKSQLDEASDHGINIKERDLKLRLFESDNAN